MQKNTKSSFSCGWARHCFLPATKAMPKELLPIVDKPLIQYAVEEAIEAGIEMLFYNWKEQTCYRRSF